MQIILVHFWNGDFWGAEAFSSIEGILSWLEDIFQVNQLHEHIRLIESDLNSPSAHLSYKFEEFNYLIDIYPNYQAT